MSILPDAAHICDLILLLYFIHCQPVGRQHLNIFFGVAIYIIYNIYTWNLFLKICSEKKFMRDA